jgi:GDPmannose 4,6-dehydratase
MSKVALITGITGQDGSYMAELLLEKGYEVHGIIRRSSSFNTGRIDHIFDELHLHHGDITDPISTTRLIHKIWPDYIYNFAAQSHVRVSDDVPDYTSQVDAIAVMHILEALRGSKTVFYQASSSEMIGDGDPYRYIFRPRSIYGIAKLTAYYFVKYYSMFHNVDARTMVLYNHESPRRGETFVSRKITLAVARIKNGLQKKLALGNIGIKRDWGYAPEYVKHIYDYIDLGENDIFLKSVCTGESHTVEEFCYEAFKCVDLDYKDYVKEDPKYMRNNDFHLERAQSIDYPCKVKFKELVEIMVEADMKLIGDRK